MREGTRALVGVVVLLLLVPAGPAASKPEDYLTKDGELRHKLEVSDLQGGFAGFVGPKIVIEPSGKFTVYKRVGRKEMEERTGKLTKAARTDLAKDLAHFDLLSLKNIGKPMTNPHNVVIVFGKTRTLVLGAGAPLPKPDTKGAGRYGGIVRAVEKAVGKGKAP